MCRHRTCQWIRDQGIKLNNKIPVGVAIIVFLLYYNKDPAVLLGLERGGKYKDQYNLAAGKLEHHDNGCYMAAMMRELAEEFKIYIIFQDFDDHFRGSSGRIRVIMHKNTPVFIGVFQGLTRSKLNRKIQIANNNHHLPRSQQEMAEVQWCFLNNMSISDRPNGVISSFAAAVLQKIDVNKL